MPRKARKGLPRNATQELRGFAAHEHRILLLQGGGALGAYHGGVYEGIAEVSQPGTVSHKRMDIFKN